MEQARVLAASRRMFIDGQWVEASNGATYAIPNPATEEPIGAARDATVDDMRRAIAAARRAFDDGPWPQSSRHDRARVLNAIAAGMERRKEELRQLVIAEAGATFLTHDIQVEQPIKLMRHYAELALTFDFEEQLPTRVSESMLGTQVNSGLVYRHPAGVCGLIPTWNFPLFVAVQKLGPALATGCTMVFKPSPYGPLINLFLAEIIAEADLPPGVINFVTGQSNAIAETLVSDPRIDKVSFTGSVATGRKILEAAAKTLKRVHLELGGKSVAIFLDTDNLDLIAPQAASPTFFHAGQGCAMPTRVLIPREAHDTLVQKMVDFVQGMVKVGDPADPGTFLGPVIREERRQKIEEYIESGKREGAVLAHGGGRPKDLRRGYFLEPTIFCAVPNTIRIAQEEIFGPVVSVIPFTDEDGAIRIANDSTYGIGDRLGLYKAMAGAGPLTSAELAQRTGCAERYVREWLAAQAAGGYVTYDAAAKTYTLPPEQAFCLADESSPTFLPGGFQVIAAVVKDEHKVAEAFRTGKGVGWHEHDPGLFEGTERFFRPNYAAHLVSEWIPALEGVAAKLAAGARVADVGCGHGASTILLAEAYPSSTFVASDYHQPSVPWSRKAASRAGVADRVRFEVASSKAYPGKGYDLVAFFDCLHDMGDPVGAAKHVLSTLDRDGTWMIVEPFAGDRVEQNLNPVGRVYYAASTMVCTPASLAQEVGLGLGAQAGGARLREVVTAGGFSRFRRATETPFNLVLEARP